MKNDKNKREERPEAYPRPSKTDIQTQSQPEYIDEEPNKFEKEVSDVQEDENNRTRNKEQ